MRRDRRIPAEREREREKTAVDRRAHLFVPGACPHRNVDFETMRARVDKQIRCAISSLMSLQTTRGVDRLSPLRLSSVTCRVSYLFVTIGHLSLSLSLSLSLFSSSRARKAPAVRSWVKIRAPMPETGTRSILKEQDEMDDSPSIWMVSIASSMTSGVFGVAGQLAGVYYHSRAMINRPRNFNNTKHLDTSERNVAR